MEGNLNELMKNQVDIEKLEKNTDGLNKGAEQFNKKAKDLKNIMKWRNYKLMIFLVLAIIGVLVLIGLIIYGIAS